jgi:hypothetical protein
MSVKHNNTNNANNANPIKIGETIDEKDIGITPIENEDENHEAEQDDETHTVQSNDYITEEEPEEEPEELEEEPEDAEEEDAEEEDAEEEDTEEEDAEEEDAEEEDTEEEDTEDAEEEDAEDAKEEDTEEPEEVDETPTSQSNDYITEVQKPEEEDTEQVDETPMVQSNDYITEVQEHEEDTEQVDETPMVQSNDYITEEQDTEEENPTTEDIEDPDDEDDEDVETSQYVYLPDKLPNMFGFCMKNPSANKYKIHLCIVKIDTECIYNYNEIPFLKFIVSNQNNKYIFPNFEYDCSQINDNNNSNQEKPEQEENQEQETNPEQVYFENECFKHILELLKDKTDIHNIDNFKDAYQGFVEYSDTDIFAVFNITNMPIFFKPENIYAVIDELVYKKQVLQTPVEDIIPLFLKKFDNIMTLKNIDQKIIDPPLQVYLCNKRAGTKEWYNIPMDQLTIVDLEFEHPFFRKCYYFSSSPLNEQNKDLPRYIIFINNCLYIMKDISKVDEKQTAEYIDKVLSSSSFYFHENNIQIWGLKDVLQFKPLKI